MQRIKMLRTVPGSLDGITQQQFEAGREYAVHDFMAVGLIAEGYAEAALERAVIDAAPETKGRKRRGAGK